MSEIDVLLRDLKKYGTAGRDCALSAEDALTIAAVLEAAREDAWQPIETCPSDGRVVMFCDERSNIWTDVTCNKSADYCTGFTPTHWRDLPAPPAIDRARGKGVQGEA